MNYYDKIEKLWNKRLNSGFLEVYDEIYHFFAQKLPTDVIEDYGTGDFVLEINSDLASAKEYDKQIKLLELIKNNHFILYQELFQYLNRDLIALYTYNNKRDKINEYFSYFIKKPNEIIDEYVDVYEKILFYGYTDVVNNAIEKNYKEILSSNNMIEDFSYEIAVDKINIFIEEQYTNNSFDVKQLEEVFEKYDIELNENLMANITKGLLENVDIDLIENFIKSKKYKDNLYIYLQIQFQKYMYDKGVSFMVSDRIYREIMHAVLEKKRLNFKNFFSLTYKSITDYFENKNAYNYSIDNREDVFALMWGGSFFYDFLFKNHLISEKTHKTFIEDARKIKGEIIGGFIDNLWQFNFVDQWGKPNCITEQEFENEVKIFQKSYRYVYSDNVKTEDVFSEELENIGDLKKLILKGIKNKKTFSADTTLLDSFFDGSFNEIFDDNFVSEKLLSPLDSIKSDRITVSDTPIRVNKIGRNEPCPCGSGKKYKKCCG